jgi:hypothetical protein
MKAVNHVKKGDARALLRWVETREADPEFANLMDEIRRTTRKTLVLE